MNLPHLCKLGSYLKKKTKTYSNLPKTEDPKPGEVKAVSSSRVRSWKGGGLGIKEHGSLQFPEEVRP